MATVKVSRKGWVVIPKQIRERHCIRPGDQVHIIDYGGSIALVPALKDPIRQMRGMFKGGPSLTQALLEERREEREREDAKMRRWASTEETDA